MDASQGDPRDNAGNRDSMIDVTEDKHVLPVALTKDERLQIAMDMASAQSDMEHLEKDKKAAVDDFNAKIEGHYADVSRCSSVLRRGEKDVEVPCETIRDYRLGNVRITRLDTFKVIQDRPMTSEERQRAIKFPDAKKRRESKS